MRTSVLAFLVFLFFGNSVQANLVPQIYTREVTHKKWVTAHIIGVTHTVKMLLSVIEMCGSTPRSDTQTRCYQDFDMLPEEPEQPGDNEAEYLSAMGAWIRSTQDAYCEIHALEKTKRQNQLACYAFWEYLKKKETIPERPCSKIDTYFEQKKRIRCRS